MKEGFTIWVYILVPYLPGRQEYLSNNIKPKGSKLKATYVIYLSATIKLNTVSYLPVFVQTENTTCMNKVICSWVG